MQQSLMPSHCTSGAGVVHKFFPLQTLQLFFAGALDELLERLKRLSNLVGQGSSYDLMFTDPQMHSHWKGRAQANK